MARHQSKKVRLVEPAAELFAENALLRDDSLFRPGQSIWSLGNLDFLHRRFVEQPDESDDTFQLKSGIWQIGSSGWPHSLDGHGLSTRRQSASSVAVPRR